MDSTIGSAHAAGTGNACLTVNAADVAEVAMRAPAGFSRPSP
jgi:hypothetical protein